MRNLRLLVELQQPGSDRAPEFTDPETLEMMTRINRALDESSFGDPFVARRMLDEAKKANPHNPMIVNARALADLFVRTRE
jgi:hypothetical protein